MTKIELVNALADAGLAPSDLQEEYARVTAARKQKRENLIKEVRDRLAYDIAEYSNLLAGEPAGDPSDTEIKIVEKMLRENESQVNKISSKNTKMSADDALTAWLKTL